VTSPAAGPPCRLCPHPGAVVEMGEVEATARRLSLDIAKLEIRRAEDVLPTFETLKGGGETFANQAVIAIENARLLCGAERASRLVQ
jgi:hypothetical protein